MIDLKLQEDVGFEALKGRIEEALPLSLMVSALTLDSVVLSPASFDDVKFPAELVAVTGKRRPRSYVTMHNGDTPYLVRILSRSDSVHSVTVLPRWEMPACKRARREDWGYEGWEQEEEEEEDWEMDELWESFEEEAREEVLPYAVKATEYDITRPILKDVEPQAVFIGKSLENSMTIRSRAYGPQFDGNAILLKRSGLVYTFIGNEIYSFLSFDEIEEFKSPMGNNLVPYSYAVDASGRHYLFLEELVLEHVPSAEPYHYFYQEMRFDRCEYRLRLNRTDVRGRKFREVLEGKRSPRTEKLVDGRWELVGALDFEGLLKSWLKSHGVRPIQRLPCD